MCQKNFVIFFLKNVVFALKSRFLLTNFLVIITIILTVDLWTVTVTEYTPWKKVNKTLKQAWFSMVFPSNKNLKKLTSYNVSNIYILYLFQCTCHSVPWPKSKESDIGTLWFASQKGWKFSDR